MHVGSVNKLGVYVLHNVYSYLQRYMYIVTGQYSALVLFSSRLASPLTYLMH